MVIGDYLGRRAIYSPARLAIVDAGKTPALRLTYAELNVRANNVAHWLRSVAGVRKGRSGGVSPVTAWNTSTSSLPAASWAPSTPRSTGACTGANC
ncbi:MAG: hypothetical protein IPO15_26930 [Anaerolineae bacterium]|uniref:hypothetical protein n=1 Tax=Candidatus Amarolinea dominans TaxID=3140696 RepID=UPI0031348212|nr:hypothetical protein [Anaerolineae bacterium]